MDIPNCVIRLYSQGSVTDQKNAFIVTLIRSLSSLLRRFSTSFVYEGVQIFGKIISQGVRGSGEYGYYSATADEDYNISM
jgi:hypothetical protein